MNDMTQPTATDTPQTWRVAEVEALFALPFSDLMFQAQTMHRTYFDPNSVQLSTLLSIKTGGCSEDCGATTPAWKIRACWKSTRC
jgi:biotin synthase